MSLKKYIGAHETIRTKFFMAEMWFFFQVVPMLLLTGALLIFWRENLLFTYILVAAIWILIFQRSHRFFTTRYFVTNEKVYKLTGFIGKKLESASVDQLENITVKQSPIGRIFGWGTLKFFTAGANASEVELRRVARPFRRKKQIEGFWEERS